MAGFSPPGRPSHGALGMRRLDGQQVPARPDTTSMARLLAAPVPRIHLSARCMGLFRGPSTILTRMFRVRIRTQRLIVDLHLAAVHGCTWHDRGRAQGQSSSQSHKALPQATTEGLGAEKCMRTGQQHPGCWLDVLLLPRRRRFSTAGSGPHQPALSANDLEHRGREGEGERSS